MSKIERTSTKSSSNFEQIGVGFDSKKITGGVSLVFDVDYQNEAEETKRAYLSILPIDKDRILNEYDGNLKQKYAKMTKAELAIAKANLPSYNITGTKEMVKVLTNLQMPKSA